VISHEHDPFWSSKVENQLEKLNLSHKSQLKLFPATDDGTPMSYWESIGNYEDESFDLVLIDGKYRDRCAIEALQKLKPSGWLIIDDVHRYLPKEPKSLTPRARSISDGYASERWGRFAELVSAWNCDWRFDGVWDTAIFWRR
jgi:predicted O-methyltransferase YrrM